MGNTASDYDFYFAALKAPDQIGKTIAIHDGEAQPGFYRKRKGRSGPFEPVAIWRDESGGLVAKVGNEMADPVALWSWVCDKPVTEDAYRAVADDGKPWPDDAPTIGHNSGPANDFEALADQIESAGATVSDYEKIADDEMQSQAQAARARLNELSREADKKRTAEKAPHLEAGKAVDAKWQPLVKQAKTAADAIAKAMSAYETAKARKEAEERRRAEEEARKAAEARTPAEVQPTAEPGPEPIKTTVKGGYGRAATVKVVKVATVTDQDKAYQAMRTHPELIECIAKLAQRAVNAGHEIDGVSVEEERKVA